MVLWGFSPQLLACETKRLDGGRAAPVPPPLLPPRTHTRAPLALPSPSALPGRMGLGPAPRQVGASPLHHTSSHSTSPSPASGSMGKPAGSAQNGHGGKRGARSNVSGAACRLAVAVADGSGGGAWWLRVLCDVNPFTRECVVVRAGVEGAGPGGASGRRRPVASKVAAACRFVSSCPAACACPDAARMRNTAGAHTRTGTGETGRSGLLRGGCPPGHHHPGPAPPA